MPTGRFGFVLAGALVCCCLAVFADPSVAGDRHGKGQSVRYPDHYEGYHLRPPYFIPGVGWHYPPKGRIDRRFYYGYHFHHDHPPLIKRAAPRHRAVRVRRVVACHCREIGPRARH